MKTQTAGDAVHHRLSYLVWNFSSTTKRSRIYTWQNFIMIMQNETPWYSILQNQYGRHEDLHEFVLKLVSLVTWRSNISRTQTVSTGGPIKVFLAWYLVPYWSSFCHCLVSSCYSSKYNTHAFLRRDHSYLYKYFTKVQAISTTGVRRHCLNHCTQSIGRQI